MLENLVLRTIFKFLKMYIDEVRSEFRINSKLQNQINKIKNLILNSNEN